MNPYINSELKTNTSESPTLESVLKEPPIVLDKSEEEAIKNIFVFMKISAAEFAASIGPLRKPLMPCSRLLYIDSLAELSNDHFGDEVESEPLQAEDMYLAEPEIITSSGRKVPKRNPKAKAWVSPYGGKRK